MLPYAYYHTHDWISGSWNVCRKNASCVMEVRGIAIVTTTQHLSDSDCCITKICGIQLSAVSCKVVFNEDFHSSLWLSRTSNHQNSLLQFAPKLPACVPVLWMASVLGDQQFLTNRQITLANSFGHPPAENCSSESGLAGRCWLYFCFFREALN